MSTEFAQLTNSLPKAPISSGNVSRIMGKGSSAKPLIGMGLLLFACGGNAFTSSSQSSNSGDASVNGTGGSTSVPGTFETVSFGTRENSTFNTGIQDTDLLSSAPTVNYGWHADFGCNASPQRVGLVRIDTSAFADTYGRGRTVLDARLHLWTTDCSGCQASPGTVVQVFSIKQYWQETANGSSEGAGGIPNWTQADIDGSSGTDVIVPWDAPGAQPPARATTELAHFGPTEADTDYPIQLPVSVVQAWLDSPDANYGVVLVVAGSTADSVSFVTSDGDSAKSPWLEVDIAN